MKDFDVFQRELYRLRFRHRFRRLEQPKTSYRMGARQVIIRRSAVDNKSIDMEEQRESDTSHYERSRR